MIGYNQGSDSELRDCFTDIVKVGHPAKKLEKNQNLYIPS